ncbi:MAG: tRNA sulfurtransferase [Nitriliruptorales bacterium]
MRTTNDVLLVTLGSEVYVKAPRTRERFREVLADNLRASLPADVEIDRLDVGRLVVAADDPVGAAEVAARTFGVHRVELARPVTPVAPLEALADTVAARAADRVAGRTFAVRTRRHGQHPWQSTDANREIGSRLLERSAGVHLDDPEVEVQVVVLDDRAWLVEEAWNGPDGLPLGTQDGCLAMLSGGFDSPVAAWSVMRRGCPIDFLHVRLDCAQTDHATAVARELWRRWGAGTSPLVWIVDFDEVEDALRESVPPRLRQVVLKQLMMRAADGLADEYDIPALVTGEAIAQVSSQTLRHLAEIDRVCSRLVLRPLAGWEKQEIVAKARQIGTEELSARAKEVCDLSAGRPVAVAAQRTTLARANAELPDDLVARAIAARRVVALEHWVPGMDAVEVVEDVPAGFELVGDDDDLPATGPVALVGSEAIGRATGLKAGGREAVVLTHEPVLAPVG